jgi:glutathione synthase
MRQMRFAFIMDPIERILPHHDTSFVLMLESQHRGHEVYYSGLEALFIRDTVPHAVSRRVEVNQPEASEPHYHLYEEQTGRLDWFDAVFMRKDPPFDLAYFYATHVLSLIDPSRAFVINHPRGLREANEKLYTLNFPDIVPPTLVTSDISLLKRFMDELGGEMIVKPLEGFGGRGVFHAHRNDRNLNAILETSTGHGRYMIMAQRYLPEVREGDKRVIVLDGKPLGGLLRIPREDEHRSNMAVGGAAMKTEITDRDREICARLAPRLSADGLYFAGLDIIGGWLTEVNVTSPTGVQEVNALDGVKLEANVIDFVERRIAQLTR